MKQGNKATRPMNLLSFPWSSTLLRSWQSREQHVAGLNGRWRPERLRSERPGRAEQSWTELKWFKKSKYSKHIKTQEISRTCQWLNNDQTLNYLINYLTMIRFKAWSALSQAFVLIQRPSGQRSAIHRASSRSLRQRSKSQKSQLPPGWRGTLRRFVMSVNLGHKLLLGVKNTPFLVAFGSCSLIPRKILGTSWNNQLQPQSISQQSISISRVRMPNKPQ